MTNFLSHSKALPEEKQNEGYGEKDEQAAAGVKNDDIADAGVRIKLVYDPAARGQRYYCEQSQCPGIEGIWSEQFIVPDSY